MMNKFKLDRTAFSMNALEVHEPAISYWQNKSLDERLAAAVYLNSVAYNFDLHNPPRLDRTAFSMRKHNA